MAEVASEQLEHLDEAVHNSSTESHTDDVDDDDDVLRATPSTGNSNLVVGTWLAADDNVTSGKLDRDTIQSSAAKRSHVGAGGMFSYSRSRSDFDNDDFLKFWSVPTVQMLQDCSCSVDRVQLQSVPDTDVVGDAVRQRPGLSEVVDDVGTMSLSVRRRLERRRPPWEIGRGPGSSTVDASDRDRTTAVTAASESLDDQQRSRPSIVATSSPPPSTKVWSHADL